MQIIQLIQNRIYEIKGERVLLDFDLAGLYEVPTKALNQAVKRNIKRCPKDFMFRLTLGEWNRIQTQVFSNQDNHKESPINMRSHNVTAFQIKRNNTTPPLCLYRTRCRHVKWNFKQRHGDKYEYCHHEGLC